MKPEIFKLILWLIIGGGFLLFSFYRRFKKARKIQDTPRSKTMSAAQGLAEFEGFAWPAKTSIQTPNGIDAVYYSFRLEKQVTTGSGKDRRTEWVTVYTRVLGDNFYIADPTGLALVMIADSDFNLESAKYRRWYSLSKIEKSRICETIVTDSISNFPPSDFLFGIFSSSFRVVENQICVGSPLHVHGDFRSTSGIEAKIRSLGLGQFCSRVFDFTQKTYQKLDHLLDRDKNGKISFEENKTGYSMIAKVAINKAIQEKQDEPEFTVFGAVATSENHKLIISDAHEAHLIERLQKYLWLQFFAGALLVTLGLTFSINPNFGSEAATMISYNLKNHKLPRAAKPVFERVPATETTPATNTNVTTNAKLDETPQEEPVNAAELHQQCLAQKPDACLKLIENKDRLQLAPANLEYYKALTCLLVKQNCKF